MKSPSCLPCFSGSLLLPKEDIKKFGLKSPQPAVNAQFYLVSLLTYPRESWINVLRQFGIDKIDYQKQRNVLHMWKLTTFSVDLQLYTDGIVFLLLDQMLDLKVLLDWALYCSRAWNVLQAPYAAAVLPEEIQLCFNYAVAVFILFHVFPVFAPRKHSRQPVMTSYVKSFGEIPWVLKYDCPNVENYMIDLQSIYTMPHALFATIFPSTYFTSALAYLKPMQFQPHLQICKRPLRVGVSH